MYLDFMSHDINNMNRGASGYPVCDARGCRHSDQCSLNDYAGVRFNVCGGCVPEVHENPADFLAEKRHGAGIIKMG